MALGRSGSSITWDAMSALTGQRNVAYEVTGGNKNSSLAFFNDLQENECAYYNWTLQRLCHVQQYRPEIERDVAGIAGFQWKPYESSFGHPYATKGLEALAMHNNNGKNPLIRIVYLHRNALDRQISNIRHRNSMSNTNGQEHGGDNEDTDKEKKITAHCAIGDEECIKHHTALNTNIQLPTGEVLLHKLHNDLRKENRILGKLKALNVTYHVVTYEELYGTHANVDAWKNLLIYLGRRRRRGVDKIDDDNPYGENYALLSMEDVTNAFSMASTHQKSRSEIVSNFDDVRYTLLGTEFEHLLDD